MNGIEEVNYLVFYPQKKFRHYQRKKKLFKMHYQSMQILFAIQNEGGRVFIPICILLNDFKYETVFYSNDLRDLTLDSAGGGYIRSI